MTKVFLLALLLTSHQATFAQPAASPPPKIKLLSWNIYMLPGFMGFRNGERAEAIGKLLAAADYDIIVLEEAFCPLARKTIRKLLAPKFPFEAGPANQKLFSLRINSGLWIFSKYPIVAHHAIAFRSKSGVDVLSRKGALLVEVNVENRSVQVIGTHLQNGGSDEIRYRQCAELYERLLQPYRRAGVAQIVCGDFNLDRLSGQTSYSRMLTALDAEDGELSGPLQATYDRCSNDLRVEQGGGQSLIDYMLLRTNGTWLRCTERRIQLLQKKWCPVHADLSDHYALSGQFYFSPLPGAISLR